MDQAGSKITRCERRTLELVQPSGQSGARSSKTHGALLGRRYRLDRLLAESGMARVWAATNTITERPVAIKIPLEWLPSDMRVLILDEARTTSAVDHPNVVRVYDAFELEDGTPIMIMELLEGETLGARLTRKGTLPLPEAARILVPVLSALRKSHALGIV